MHWRHFLHLLLLLSLIGLPGCWDSVEIDNLGIAIAAAVDLTPDNKVMFSEQVYVPGTSENGTEGAPGETGGRHYFVFSGTGVDIREAHLNLQKLMSRRLFIADRNLYLISEQAARHGINGYIDELVRNPQSRLRTHVAVTRGRAVDYLNIAYPFEQTPGAALRKLIFGYGSNYKLDLNTLLQMIQKPGQHVVTPMIEMHPAAPSEDDVFQVAGMAVFNDGKMVGSLSQDASKGVMWLREQMAFNQVTAEVPGHDGTIASSLLRTRYKFDPHLVNGKPVMDVHLVLESDLIENNTDLDFNKPADVELAQTVLAKKVTATIQQALQQLQQKYDSDVIKFAERFQRAESQAFKQSLQKNWDAEFAKMPVHVTVEEKIRRNGMTGKPLPRPGIFKK